MHFSCWDPCHLRLQYMHMYMYIHKNNLQVLVFFMLKISFLHLQKLLPVLFNSVQLTNHSRVILSNIRFLTAGDVLLCLLLGFSAAPWRRFLHLLPVCGRRCCFAAFLATFARLFTDIRLNVEVWKENYQWNAVSDDAVVEAPGKDAVLRHVDAGVDDDADELRLQQ